MKPVLLLGVLLLAAFSFAQDPKEGLSRSAPARPVAVSDAPVTQTEARNTSKRMESLLKNTVGVKTFAPTKLKTSAKPITREMVIADFVRIYEAVRPSVKLTPAPVKFSESRFRVSSTTRPSLAKLVKLGLVAPYGPLATSKQATLSVQEYGDAVGFFLSRVAELTHMPSRKWTPALQGND